MVQRVFQTDKLSVTSNENVGYAWFRLLRSHYLESHFEGQLAEVLARHCRSAMLHVISLAKYAAVHTCSWAADSSNAWVRFRAERDRSLEDAAVLREEMLTGHKSSVLMWS